MSRNFKVIDTKNWIQHQKAEWLASELGVNYRKLINKLSGSDFNDTPFVYGELIIFNDCRIFKNKDGIDFIFRYVFKDKNKMQFFYIVEIESKLVKISKENGETYLNKLVEI